MESRRIKYYAALYKSECTITIKLRVQINKVSFHDTQECKIEVNFCKEVLNDRFELIFSINVRMLQQALREYLYSSISNNKLSLKNMSTK
jgi:hypothetical protein